VADPVVVFRDARLTIGGQRVVGPLRFAVERGETVILLGRSGSGKTTTLRLANALLLPSEGEVIVEGRATTAWDPVRLRRSAGYVIQEVGLLPHFTVANNVSLVPRLERWPAARRTARAAELLELVGLPPDPYASRYPHQLSGGQRQRVGLARALAADPPILLCDEPFGAVDPVTRRDLQQEFAALADRLGKTVLFVTHDVREALALGDRIALLDDGIVRFLGTPDGFSRSTDPAVQTFREGS
jgi:osmoprotectant transport system ATP-binding protein